MHIALYFGNRPINVLDTEYRRMKKIKRLMGIIIAGAVIVSAQAQADLVLDDSDADYSGPGFQPFKLDADWLEGLVGAEEDLFLLYKDEVGGNEEGSWKDDYSVSYCCDYTGLWLTNDGDDSMSGALWLVVKDGAKHDPAWYVFDISGWDGEMDIHISGLFPNGGAISNVQIFGPESSVPEPGTLAVFGAALIGIGLARRWRLWPA
jgi:hypothetical protein